MAKRKGYQEKNFQQEFKDKNNLFGAFELKICKGTSMPFSSIADHQFKALLDINSKRGLYHKLTDIPVSAINKTGIEQGSDNKKSFRFVRPSPFDCFVLNTEAYIVVMFYELRKKKNVYYIHIRDLINLIETANRKSLTEEMAQEASFLYCSYLKRKLNE